MFQKRAFLQQYVNGGMEEGQFIEAIEDVKSLLQDYEEIVQDVPEEEEQMAL